MDKQKLLNSITQNESLRLKSYLCPAKRITIGYGRNVEDKGITQDEALYLLNNDILEINNELSKFAFFESLNDVRQNVLIEMVYNMGMPRFKGFKNMIKCLENGEYQNASDEMLNSKWHKDFINYAPTKPIEELRSSKLAKLMKEGKYV